MKLKNISQRLVVEVEKMALEHPNHAHLFSLEEQRTLDGKVKCCILTCKESMFCRCLCRSHYHRRQILKNLRPNIPIQYDHKFYGDRNPKWNGGKTTSTGRILLRAKLHPHANDWGYVYRYRLVMEEKIGRYLNPNEIVHHINENITDDRIENLQLMTSSEHSKQHMKNRTINKKGQLCRK